MPSNTYCYEHPRPAVTVDLVVLAHRGPDLVALLVRRGGEPFAGSWAIPGGFLDLEEQVEDAARRELREETGVDLAAPVAFLGAFAAPDRDPRGRTISLAHVAYLPGDPPEVAGGDDAAEAAWRPADLVDPAAMPLAFDHGAILRKAIDWLQGYDGTDQAEMLRT